MTFKQSIGKKVVELESALDARDYKLLKKESSDILYKTRYCVNGWEIDFFKNNGEIYFVQAEIEMPEEQKNPSKIPDLISLYLIYTVEQKDNRFSSRKLSDVKYAYKLLKELT